MHNPLTVLHAKNTIQGAVYNHVDWILSADSKHKHTHMMGTIDGQRFAAVYIYIYIYIYINVCPSVVHIIFF
jgi:hypothetical protein